MFGKWQVKLIGAAIVATLIFGLGWKVNGWRLNAKYARTQAAVIAAYEAEQERLNQEFAEKQAASNSLQASLAFDLEQSAARVRELQEKTRAQRLALDAAELESRAEREITGVCEDGREVTAIVVNPIGVDFVRLWNESARGAEPGDAGATAAGGSDAAVREDTP